MTAVHVGLHAEADHFWGHHVRPNLGGDPQSHGPRRHDGAARDHRAGAHQCTRFHHRSMQDDRPRTDQRTVVDDAPLQVGEVPDHTFVANNRRLEKGGVNNGAVLDGRAGADHNFPVVAPQNRPWPDTRFRTNLDRADHHRLRRNVGGRVDLRHLVAQCVNRHPPTVSAHHPAGDRRASDRP